MTSKIRSGHGPLIKDCEKGLRIGGLAENWNYFKEFGFGGKVRRRGTHVNVPEIGSRVGKLCIWGNSSFYAELRREIGWGNLDWVDFGRVGGWWYVGKEEGGHYVFFWCFGGVVLCRLDKVLWVAISRCDTCMVCKRPTTPVYLSFGGWGAN
jgi:hypothetical protein